MRQTDSHSDKSLTSGIFGGLSLTWPRVLFMAVGAGALTAAFLILPVFKGTSFERMGVHLEAWFIPAVLIMANAKKPLEAALKTFVFFLVSQPLIYLIQVPFSALGWGLFRFWSPSDIMKTVKSASSLILRKEFPVLSAMPSLWTRSFFVSTAGDVSAQTIQRYVETQKTRP